MIIKAKKIFNGDKFLLNHHLVIKGDKIKKIQPNHSLSSSKEVIDFGKTSIVPGFIDIHVNGGGGVLFNNDYSENGLRKIIATHAAYGTTGIMPTLITDKLEVTQKALQSVNQVIKEKTVPGILGIHLEGPFINKAQKGTHQIQFITEPNKKNIEIILKNARNFSGKKIITLAPEKFSLSQLQTLAKADFIIMAGHSDANFGELEKRSQFLDGFTHFFNGMGKFSAREPNTIGFALYHTLANSPKQFWVSLIIDNFHIHPAVLKIFFALYPSKKILLITDAMPTLGHHTKSFYLQGKKIVKKNHLYVDEDNIISGTELSMIKAVDNFSKINQKFFSIEEILRMASLYPAQYLGLTKKVKYGKLLAGYQASFTVIDELFEKPNSKPLKVSATMIDGNWIYRK